MSQEIPIPRKTPVPALLFVGLGACAAFWRTYHAAFFIHDLGHLFDAAYRITRGEVPYRDFELHVTPLTYYVLAAGLKVFGQFYFVSRVYTALQCGLLAGLTYLFCERALKLDWPRCALLSAFAIIWSPQIMLGSMWYDADSTFCVLLSGLLLFKAWSSEQEQIWWNGLGGAACAAAFWFKQDIGAGAVAGAALVATAWAWGGARAQRRNWLAFVAGVAFVFSLVLLYFAAHGALGDMWYWIVERALTLKWSSHSSHVGETRFMFFSPFTTPVDRSSKYVVLLYVLAPVGTWLRYRYKRSREELVLLGVSLTWLASFYAGLFTHHGQAYSGRMATFACVLGILGRPWPEGAPAWLRGRALQAAFMAGVVVIALRGLHYNGNYSPHSWPIHRLTTPRLSGVIVDGKATALDPLVAYIDKNVPPDEDFIVLEETIVYFATQRDHPHPFVDFSYGVITPDDEDDAIRRIQSRNTRWYFHLGDAEDFRQDTLWGNRKLKLFIEENFQLRESRDGFTVWIRKKI